MPNKNVNIKTEEDFALDKYAAERDKLSGEICKTATKRARLFNMASYVGGSAVLGLMMGILFITTHSNKLVRDKEGHVVEYKAVRGKLAETTLLLIATILVASLAFSELTTCLDKKANRLSALKLANNTFKDIFGKSLQSYMPDEHVHMRTVRAAALILNNMPEVELNRLRALAMSGLNCDANGKYSISSESITTASHIISNFIGYNPELGYNIVRIMRGDEPTTYFLPSLMKQKTK